MCIVKTLTFLSNICQVSTTPLRQINTSDAIQLIVFLCALYLKGCDSKQSAKFNHRQMQNNFLPKDTFQPTTLPTMVIPVIYEPLWKTQLTDCLIPFMFCLLYTYQCGEMVSTAWLCYGGFTIRYRLLNQFWKCHMMLWSIVSEWIGDKQRNVVRDSGWVYKKKLYFMSDLGSFFAESKCTIKYNSLWTFELFQITRFVLDHTTCMIPHCIITYKAHKAPSPKMLRLWWWNSWVMESVRKEILRF